MINHETNHSTNQPDIDAELIADRNAYLRELSADLEEIEQLILSLPNPEGAADRQRKLARDIHSIKGVAGSFGVDLLSVAVHRMEDDLALHELAAGDADKYVDMLLRHKDRLAHLAAAYLNDDQQALADIQLAYGHPNPTPPATADKPRCAIAQVLLIDTSRATLKACVGLLKDIGVAKIATMQDGYEALGRLLKEPFDAVITSLHVPTIDGQSLLPVLRTIPGPNQMTPVILLTASATALDPAAARPDHIVEKNPQMAQRLTRILNQLAGARSVGAPIATPKIDRVLKKIVLVDDSAAIHQLLKLSFKRFPDIQIASLEDPTAAEDFIRSEQPDLVLLDVNMPQTNGKDVIRSLRLSADLKDVPVAFLTADSGADERAELYALGAWEVFQKPFLPKSFADEVIKAYHER